MEIATVADLDEGTDTTTDGEPIATPPRRTARFTRTGWLRWIAGIIGGLAVVVVLAIAILWWRSRPPTPDAFYEPPSSVPGTPGALLRSEPFTRNLPQGSQ